MAVSGGITEALLTRHPEQARVVKYCIVSLLTVYRYKIIHYTKIYERNNVPDSVKNTVLCPCAR